GNGNGGFFYNEENEIWYRTSERYLASMTTSYFPAEWVTFDATIAYDNRHRLDKDAVVKGYRTGSEDFATNRGNFELGNRTEEAMNGSVGATFRKQFKSDLSGKLSFKGLFDQNTFVLDNGRGEQFAVKDVFTLSNTTTNKTATSSTETVKNRGFLAAASTDYKGRYILD